MDEEREDVVEERVGLLGHRVEEGAEPFGLSAGSGDAEERTGMVSGCRLRRLF
ncbi:hypothetical protein ACIA6D_29800 [Streptomyces cacaoi]